MQLTGRRFAKPPCPVGLHGHHQYEHKTERDTDLVQVHACRLCGRTLAVNRLTGNTRQRKPPSAK